MKTTRKEVEGVFGFWVSCIGGRVATSYNDVGAYRLDHNSIYGGYTIERICNEGGGVSQPIGADRLSAYYFVAALRKAMRTVEELRLNARSAHVFRCPKMGGGCAHFTALGEVK